MTDAWYNNPVWVGIWIAAIGSFIAVVGQLTAAYLPILTSDSAGDFAISIDNIYYTIIKNNASNSLQYYQEGYKPGSRQELNVGSVPINSLIIAGKIVTVTDQHSILRPYQHSVFVHVSGELPKGMQINFFKPEGKPPFFAVTDIKFTNEIEVGDYPVIIQGLGGDGRVQSCRIHIHVRESKVPVSSDGRNETSSKHKT